MDFVQKKKPISKKLRQAKLLLFGLSYLICSCNQHDQNKTDSKRLKVVDKATMINIITTIEKNIQLKGDRIAEGKKLLAPYLSKYKISINNSLKGKTDSAQYLKISIVDTIDKGSPEVYYFDLYPPKSSKDPVTFNDLKSLYGEWTITQPMEDPVIKNAIFNSKHNPDVGIIIRSRFGLSTKINPLDYISIVLTKQERDK
ncbi:hypothetical protein [Mucilaginibacter sp. KACC 22063]|uniref:hypothetical protein n=1 Tax=Mucilaginibacter sp. KACC 22063 TaxID=3025666 RepID=UPI002366F072|nr:hypothetical protein [Mucilaginibacter sp. KACC 22063]WDF53945.1 hypothetical protein PQ461_13435 [Mucilaginibacter sp. KACC 22063]